MRTSRQHILALDVGEKRIGIAHADLDTRIPTPLVTVEVDGLERERLRQIIAEYQPIVVVVGLPRNQDGEETAQSTWVRQFVEHNLTHMRIPINFQDESLTSVAAENFLKQSKKTYTKADIDMYAAAIILTDYLEAKYGY